MSVRQVELVVVAISFLVVGLILGVEFQKQRTEPVIIDRIIPIEKVVTQNVTQYVDRIVIKEVPYKLSSNTTISLDMALAIIAEGKNSHLNMVLYPEYQTAWTGDTAFNQGWVTFYTRLEDFIKWEVNRIKELEVEK